MKSSIYAIPFLLINYNCFSQEGIKANARALPEDIEIKKDYKPHVGDSFAVEYDILSHTSRRIALTKSDNTTLTSTGDPGTGTRFDFPVVPADKRVARIEFNGGSSYCTGSFIGNRHFITAGHCVYASGAFRSSAVVYPGYDVKNPANGYTARRLIAFSGWTDSEDASHDIGIVELATSPSLGVVPFNIYSRAPSCTTTMAYLFRRITYQGLDPQQFLYDSVHNNCKYNQISFKLGTRPGSSGSAAVDVNTNGLYAIYSNYRGDVGYDTWLTPGKVCHISSTMLGGTC